MTSISSKITIDSANSSMGIGSRYILSSIIILFGLTSSNDSSLAKDENKYISLFLYFFLYSIKYFLVKYDLPEPLAPVIYKISLSVLY